MNKRSDLSATDLSATDLSAIDDQLVTIELSETLEFVADFLARAEGPMLRADFAEHTNGGYTLEELRGDLRRFAHWLIGQDRP